MTTLRILSLALTALAVSACPAQAPSAPAQAPAGAQPAQAAVKQIPVGAGPHGIDAALGFVYNADVGASQLSVIDAAKDAVAKTIPFDGGAPGYVKAFNDGKHVLVIDSKKGELRVIDPAKDHATVQTVALGPGADEFVVGADDRTVLVSLTEAPQVLQLTFGADRTQPPTRKEIAVGTVIGAQFKHRAIAFNEGWLVAPNSGENDVSLVNMAGGTATTLSDVGLTPTDIAVDKQLGRAYVTMAGSNEVAVIDYVAKKTLGKLPVGKRPVHIYMAPGLPGPAPQPASSGAPAQLALLDHPDAPLSHELWVGNDDGESVTVLDGESLRVKATVMTDKGHHKMAFWGAKAYVSNQTAANVSVVDRTMLR